MRKMMLAAMAAMAVGAAQAVTVNWTDMTAQAKDQGTHEGITLNVGESLTIAAKMTYGATLSTGAILSFGHSFSEGASEGTSMSVAAKLVSNGVYTLTAYSNILSDSWSNLSSSDSSIQAIPGSEQLVALSVKRESPNRLTVRLSVDGVEAATLSCEPSSESAFGFFRVGGVVGDGQFGYSSSDGYNSDGTEGAGLSVNGVWIASSEGVDAFLDAATIKREVEALGVPEPTALALLALGVAGLALRRRVA